MDYNLLSFNIRCDPQAKQSVRFHSLKDGRIIKHVDPKKQTFQAYLTNSIASQLPEGFVPWSDCAIAINRLLYVFPIPKSISKRKQQEMKDHPDRCYPKTTRPDIDNLYKPVADALNGVVIADDSQLFIRGLVMKIYGEVTGIRLILERITNDYI